MFWGAIVGALVLAVVSLYTPPPQTARALDAQEAASEPEVVEAEPVEEAPAQEVEVAEPAPAPELVEDVEPVEEAVAETTETAPETDETETAEAAESAEISGQDTTEAATAEPETTQAAATETANTDATETDAPEPAPEVAQTESTTPEAQDTSPQLAEEVTAPQTVEIGQTAQAVTEQVETEIAAQQPAAPNAQDSTPQAPQLETQPAKQPNVSTQIADTLNSPAQSEGLSVADEQLASVTPVAPNLQELSAPVISDISPQAIADPDPAPRPEPVEETQVAEDTKSAIPQITTESTENTSSGSTLAGSSTLGDKATKVVVNRLPTISGNTSQNEANAEPETELDLEAAPETTTAEATDLGAVRAYAANAEVQAGQSLFSVILIDAGENGMSRDALLDVGFPATIAVDPIAQDASEAMKAFRGAGFEVIAIPEDLPQAASPSDVEVAMSGYFNVMSEVIGVLDPLDGRIQSNRSLLQPVLGAIRASGHGLVTYNRGLNSAVKAARREEIPAATVFRILDGDLENGATITRYLDRAAFAAGKDGSVVVVGRSYPETVEAIGNWIESQTDGALAFVPVSAVMLAAEGS
jgi:polysaccharide deacetylase 2 family uncharacterized protein YibQ